MTNSEDDRITVLAREFTPAAMEFHRRAMGAKGYTLAGPVVSHKLLMLEGPGEPVELFGGDSYFAAVFVKRSVSES